ncbi:MAG: hypothetical protein KBG02_04575 [Haliscomenobacter sp.]|nr:hypothetical protein [Haliscomenobacter sp.]
MKWKRAGKRVRFLALCFLGGEREVSFLFRLAGAIATQSPVLTIVNFPY